MQAYGYIIVLAPRTSFDGGGGASSSSSNIIINKWWWSSSSSCSRRRFTVVRGCDRREGKKNHYQVLGLSPHASSSHIKRAYRLLALKYHPDVNKDVGAIEDFKSIRLAYDILIDETTRTEYDKALCYQESNRRPLGDEWAINTEYEDGLRVYRWAYLRRRMQHAKYWEHYHNGEENFSFSDDADEMPDEKNQDERGSFIEVLKSAFLSLFLMQTVGSRLSLTYSSLMALIDPKLDTGYKFGYFLAWILGGRAGILLTVFLSFATWVCGKTSSSVVALLVVAMWFGSNIARYAPLPQGALLTLLYMSIKLQVDLT